MHDQEYVKTNHEVYRATKNPPKNKIENWQMREEKYSKAPAII